MQRKEELFSLVIYINYILLIKKAFEFWLYINYLGN